MTKSLFSTALFLGAAAVLWMAAIFVGSDALALTITLVIGGVFAIGVFELHQFRQATASLRSALKHATSEVTSLDSWLAKLHPTLQNPVQLRIEGERIGLPTPVLTPYLVGLLVMLGLLGTFVGMVDTLKGAVVALEGNTDLQAIRAGLTAPIHGLGLAFGTSVAGVAASAMLGLMSTISRRERMFETQTLDNKITSIFRAFSLTHQRQEAFKALQYQSQALPAVADKLATMTESFSAMGDKLSEALISNQNTFQQTVTTNFQALANSVDKSLRESAAESGRITAESGRLAGESIKPVVQEAMAAISAEIKSGTQQTHRNLSNTAEQQLTNLSNQYGETSEKVSKAWQTGLTAQEDAGKQLIENMQLMFSKFNDSFSTMTESVLGNLQQTSSEWVSRQESADKERLSLWATSFENAQDKANEQLTGASKLFSNELQQISEHQKDTIQSTAKHFETVSDTLTHQWRETSEQTLAQQQKFSNEIGENNRSFAETNQSNSAAFIEQITGLLNSSEQLVQTRIESESRWLAEHKERMTELATVLRTELTALNQTETSRGQDALKQLSELEGTVAKHLAELGQSLEEPMTRLISTASETPKAAAEVIQHLRNEISNNIERDNDLLEERRRIIEDLNGLTQSMAQSSEAQRSAIENLVNSSTETLQTISSDFSKQIQTETTKISDVANHFSGSAAEMASLGEAFSLAVEFFNDSNLNLIESLNRIEGSLEQSGNRNNEQLGYYVAQARDIIDHSIVSQKQMLEELRNQTQQEELFSAEANA